MIFVSNTSQGHSINIVFVHTWSSVYLSTTVVLCSPKAVCCWNKNQCQWCFWFVVNVIFLIIYTYVPANLINEIWFDYKWWPSSQHQPYRECLRYIWGKPIHLQQVNVIATKGCANIAAPVFHMTTRVYVYRVIALQLISLSVNALNQNVSKKRWYDIQENRSVYEIL